MKKALAVFGMLFGLASAGFAGTPQEVFFQGQNALSGATILTSTASTTSLGSSIFTLAIATPTAINSGGTSYSGRNCFTKFVVQIPTTTVITIADGAVTKWTIYGIGLGTTGVTTKDFVEDHLGPWCTATGNATTFVLTNTGGNAVPAVLNVEGYTTYGGVLNQGNMN